MSLSYTYLVTTKKTEKWSARLAVCTVIIGLRHMLNEPSSSSPYCGCAKKGSIPELITYHSSLDIAGMALQVAELEQTVVCTSSSPSYILSESHNL
jgi:hypothetical protein